MRNGLLAATVLASCIAASGVALAQPVTGLYIGVGGGANFLQREQIRTVPPQGLPGLFGNAGFNTGYAGLGNVGYGFGNGLRAEIEGNFRSNDIRGNQAGFGVNGREQKYGGMVNALFDLDIGSPYIYPYIGAGVGYEMVQDRARLTSGPYAATVDGSKGDFAYQAIAGLSFPIAPVLGLSLTAEYRYMAVAGRRDFPAQLTGPGVAASGMVRAQADFNHSLIVGLRYAFNVAPPAPPATAVLTPPPAAESARTYLVFFDWDRADLTSRARQVVAEAAKATTRVQVTRLAVNGYTDTSGTPSYNQGLSVRRAQAVANELVRDGVSRAAISIQGYGQTRLLVPTAAGVREPQNRRVEIILQ